jgi:16S rRNA processing protein RimM
MPPRGEEWMVVARVVRPRGRAGEVLMEIETDFPEERLAAGPAWLRSPRGHTSRHEVESVWFHKGRAVVKLEGTGSIGEAEGLRGFEWVVPEDEAMDLPEGTYYRHRLEGLEARSPAGERLGRVLRVEKNPGTDLLVLESGGREVLVPMAQDFVREVREEDGTVVLDLPPELLDLAEG